MTRSRLLLLALLGLAVLAVPATAKAPKLPHVSFKGWTVYSPGAATKAKPGATVTQCLNPGELLARGPVRGAIKHQKYLETWSLNGKKTDAFTISWNGKGNYQDSWSLTTDKGFRNGKWTITLTRRGKLIGRESVRLRCK